MEDALAGCLAGLVSTAILYPVDTLKSRVLSGQWGHGGKRLRVLQNLRLIAQTEGISALYRGVGAVILLATPANGIYFGAYEFFKKRLERAGCTGSKVPLVSGMAANFAALVIWIPQDVIKERQQVLQSGPYSDPSYRTVFGSVRKIVHDNGIAGLYRGGATSALLYTPLCALYFALYEDYKERAVRWAGVDSEDGLTMPWHFAGGLYAGGVAAFVTTPLDVVKIRLQVLPNGGQAVDILRAITRQNLLFKGWESRVGAIAPNFALTIATWEWCRAAVRMVHTSQTLPVSAVPA